MTRWVRLCLLATALAAGACNSSDTTNSPTPTVVSPTVTTTLSGTIPAPVAGQATPSVTVTFNSNGSGTGQVTVTSAVETLTGGTLLPSVQIGLQLGTGGVSNCVLPSGSSPFFAVASPSALQASFSAGANCFVVTSGDQSATAGPVTFTLVVLAF